MKGGGEMKRNVAICILLSIMTCGLYSFYWIYCLHQEVHSLDKQEHSSAGMALLLMFLTCGIYLFYWMYQQGKIIDRLKGIQSSQAMVYMVLSIFGLSLVSLAIMQADVNQLV